LISWAPHIETVVVDDAVDVGAVGIFEIVGFIFVGHFVCN
jgi:hypothetical protein